MLYRAWCVNNIDPLGQGRIQFRLRHNDTTPIEQLPWAEPCSPFGGADNIDGAGFFFVPRVGSQVWIAFEQNDSNIPIWLGSSFYNELGEQNPPTELKAAQEPLVYGIKTPAGHKLVFDDRNETETTDYPIHVTLVDRYNSGLTITSQAIKGGGIRLGFGTSGGELKITRIGLNLKSNGGAGLYLNDNDNTYKFANPTNTSVILLQNDSTIIRGENAVVVSTPSSAKVEAKNGLYLESKGGPTNIKASSVKCVSGSDIVFQTGGNFNANSNQFNFTGQLGSNFTIDLPIPGTPGLNQGNVLIQTAGGGILLRNGLPVPGTPPISTPTFTANDATMPTSAGRLAIGDLTSGNALLEGRLGGIFISGSPVLLPGTAGGLGGRAPIPSSPIVPLLTPGGVQPAVLGGNLYQLLVSLNTSLLTFLNTLTTSSPKFVITPTGPGVLNPAVVVSINTLVASLTTLQNTYFSPSPGIPTNILSSTVFLDG